MSAPEVAPKVAGLSQGRVVHYSPTPEEALSWGCRPGEVVTGRISRVEDPVDAIVSLHLDVHNYPWIARCNAVRHVGQATEFTSGTWRYPPQVR